MAVRTCRRRLAGMSVFTEEEIEYLRSQTLARIATVGPDGHPHVIPVTFWFNEELDTIDIGGIAFGKGKKWRDAKQNPKVTFLLDDTFGSGKDRQARALEVRGEAELHETGGNEINPRFPNFAPQFFRIRPTRIVSWGLDEAATGRGFQRNARTVSQQEE
jgi:pyridoxamine 5'-phosphate oxidase family protein